MDDRPLADIVIDTAEIWCSDVPQPLPGWQKNLIRQMYPEPEQPPHSDER